MDNDTLEMFVNQAQRLVDDLSAKLEKQEGREYSVTLDDSFAECERGNVLLVKFAETSGEGDAVNAWIRLDGDIRLEVAWRSKNYPSLTVQLVRLSDAELFQHLVKAFDANWTIRKLNLQDDDHSSDRREDALREAWAKVKKEKGDA
jgi:hypothetical protein